MTASPNSQSTTSLPTTTRITKQIRRQCDVDLLLSARPINAQRVMRENKLQLHQCSQANVEFPVNESKQKLEEAENQRNTIQEKHIQL